MPRQTNHTAEGGRSMPRDSRTGLYDESYFHELLALEKKRHGRSKDPLSLTLADLSAISDPLERQKIAISIAEVLSNTTRDTDIKGWYVRDRVIGIIFTEMTDKARTARLVQQQVADQCSRVSPLIVFEHTTETDYAPTYQETGYQAHKAN